MYSNKKVIVIGSIPFVDFMSSQLPSGYSLLEQHIFPTGSAVGIPKALSSGHIVVAQASRFPNSVLNLDSLRDKALKRDQRFLEYTKGKSAPIFVVVDGDSEFQRHMLQAFQKKFD